MVAVLHSLGGPLPPTGKIMRSADGPTTGCGPGTFPGSIPGCDSPPEFQKSGKESMAKEVVRADERPLIDVTLLGPVQMTATGKYVDLGSIKRKTLFAALALAEGRAVPRDAL